MLKMLKADDGKSDAESQALRWVIFICLTHGDALEKGEGGELDAEGRGGGRWWSKTHRKGEGLKFVSI